LASYSILRLQLQLLDIDKYTPTANSLLRLPHKWRSICPLSALVKKKFPFYFRVGFKEILCGKVFQRMSRENFSYI
jgi:hypothetical protein